MRGWCFACLLMLSRLAVGGEAAPEKAPPMSPRQRALASLMDEAMLATWDTDKGLDALVRLPTGEGNAAEYYARLESYYPKEKDKDKITVPAESRGVQEILAAAKIRRCELTPKFYPHMEKGTSNQPDILVFQAYYKALLEHAKEMEKQGKVRSAVVAYESALIWGWHFTTDRPNLVTYMLGLSIKLRAARAYSRLLQRLLYFDKARAAEAYAELIGELIRRLSAKARVYLGDLENFNCLYATIKVAKHDQEPLWRQEAVLRLGVLRHGAPDRDLKSIVKNPALQRLATDALLYVSENDPKPWIRKLAQWSVQNVTPERFNEMRRRSLFKRLEEKTEEPTPPETKEETPKTPALE